MVWCGVIWSAVHQSAPCVALRHARSATSVPYFVALRILPLRCLSICRLECDNGLRIAEDLKVLLVFAGDWCLCLLVHGEAVLAAFGVCVAFHCASCVSTGAGQYCDPQAIS